MQTTSFVVIGTRADAIKMMPVYFALRDMRGVSVKLISTGQHRDLLEDVFATFGVQPDIDLQVMIPGQSLTDLVSSIVKKFGVVLRRDRPACVLIHGDTASSYGASLAAFYENILIGHVEAGLRTADLRTPFPEEFHRQAISLVADIHFSPSKEAKINLLERGIDPDKVFVTGNTIADSLSLVFEKQKNDSSKARRSVLLTMHRRENQNELLQIINAILDTAKDFPDIDFNYVLHPNLRNRSFIADVFAPVKNVKLLAPMRYGQFISKLAHSDLVLTDSGGIQEEGALLNRTVLLVRDKTERPDGVLDGTVKLIGSKPEMIRSALPQYLKNLGHTQPVQTFFNSIQLGASARVANIIAERILT